MRLEMTGSFDADGSAASSNDLLFLGFHGYSNDENREWCASSTRSVQPAVPTTRITPTPTETATSIAIPTAIPLPTHPSSPTTSHSAAHIRAHTSAATTGIPTDAPSASANMNPARSAPKWCACCNRRYSSVSARC